jgi:hypothetical protein
LIVFKPDDFNPLAVGELEMGVWHNLKYSSGLILSHPAKVHKEQSPVPRVCPKIWKTRVIEVSSRG